MPLLLHFHFSMYTYFYYLVFTFLQFMSTSTSKLFKIPEVYFSCRMRFIKPIPFFSIYYYFVLNLLQLAFHAVSMATLTESSFSSKGSGNDKIVECTSMVMTANNYFLLIVKKKAMNRWQNAEPNNILQLAGDE